ARREQTQQESLFGTERQRGFQTEVRLSGCRFRQVHIKHPRGCADGKNKNILKGVSYYYGTD
ncbi:MAG: hypothetical protein IIZ68_08400, partial [Clostridia bacterium]|nr:hypothetical protein [Clostridia bacterium]